MNFCQLNVKEFMELLQQGFSDSFYFCPIQKNKEKKFKCFLSILFPIIIKDITFFCK